MADDLHTLSAPYALDALTPDERDQFEEHLRTCARCQAELAGLQDAAASLAFAVEGPVPPPALRSAILDAATVAPAAFWGLDGFGRLDVGAEAHVLVLDADPTRDATTLSRIVRVL